MAQSENSTVSKKTQLGHLVCGIAVGVDVGVGVGVGAVDRLSLHHFYQRVSSSSESRIGRWFYCRISCQKQNRSTHRNGSWIILRIHCRAVCRVYCRLSLCGASRSYCLPPWSAQTPSIRVVRCLHHQLPLTFAIALTVSRPSLALDIVLASRHFQFY